jgi:glycine cleavage system H protein
MSDFLETTVDKFTFKFVRDRLYTSEGAWAKGETRPIRIGLTSFVQQRSGEVAFVEDKQVGTALAPSPDGSYPNCSQEKTHA